MLPSEPSEQSELSAASPPSRSPTPNRGPPPLGHPDAQHGSPEVLSLRAQASLPASVSSNHSCSSRSGQGRSVGRGKTHVLPTEGSGHPHRRPCKSPWGHRSLTVAVVPLSLLGMSEASSPCQTCLPCLACLPHLASGSPCWPW